MVAAISSGLSPLQLGLGSSSNNPKSISSSAEGLGALGHVDSVSDKKKLMSQAGDQNTTNHDPHSSNQRHSYDKVRVKPDGKTVVQTSEFPDGKVSVQELPTTYKEDRLKDALRRVDGLFDAKV